MTTTEHRRGARLARCVAAGLILGVMSIATGPTSYVSAQEGGSAGCNEVNAARYDGRYTFEEVGLERFSAGDTITVSAGDPIVGRRPDVVNLVVDDEVVGFAAFPATLSYSIPADGTYEISWRVNINEATWNVSCVPRPPCTITGTERGDVLAGTPAAEVICGLGGGDVIYGGGGNDLIFGGEGGDVIRGDGGQDQLFGEDGGDVIDGRDQTSGDVVHGGAGGDAVAGDPGDTVAQ